MKTKCKKLMLLIAIILLTIPSIAQLRGEFYTARDGHIYFQAINTLGYNFNVFVSAVSIDGRESPVEYISVGQGFYLGPSTPWRWFWKKGDIILVTYPDGSQFSWKCPYTDRTYNNNVSFKGKHCNGIVGCDCPGFAPIQHKEVWKQAYCKHCGHHRSYHK